MKRFVKIFVNILAVAMLAGACLGLTGCGEDIRKLEVTVSVYDADEGDAVEKKLTIDLYRHLAPETVDAVLEYINAGYYNDTFFYEISDYSSQIMVGDLKFSADKEIEQVLFNGAIPPAIEGEFERGGTTGSNLTNKEGSIGLWRTWTATDDATASNGFDTSTSVNTGRATWFMPTADLSSYDKWFCVFAQVDLEDEDNKETWELIKTALAFDTETLYSTYTVYYTGEYDATEADANYGLTFNVYEGDKEEFDEQVENGDIDAFEAEGGEYVAYNAYEIKVPLVNKGNSSKQAAGARIVSVAVI